jgi:hypothetical protein
MKRAFTFFSIVIALVTGVWGYAYELAYFAFLKLNVHEILGPAHFLFSGFSVIGPMFAMLVVFALLMKFFSKDIARDDLKVVSEHLAKSKFTDEINLARVGFLLSLVFLFLVIIDTQLPSLGEAPATRLGVMFWLFTFFNMQLFFGSICVSPVHSRGAVVLAFVLAVSMCFAAGGIEAARFASRSDTALRDDGLVKVYRKDNQLIAEPKSISAPFPLWNKFMQLIDTK